MSRRTYTYNAWESQLTGSLLSGATTVVVDSATGLVHPVILVIDWDIPASREWVKVGDVSGNILSSITRNLVGSAGDVTHNAGAKIRAVWTKQHLDDLFADIEDLEAADIAHAALPSVHHAKYLDAEVDARIALADLSDPATQPHSALTGVTTSQHHVKYTDAEAAAKILADDDYLKNTGDEIAGVQVLDANLVRNIHAKATAPTTPTTGDVWLDTS